jgi:hypothetical protein
MIVFIIFFLLSGIHTGVGISCHYERHLQSIHYYSATLFSSF